MKNLTKALSFYGNGCFGQNSFFHKIVKALYLNYLIPFLEWNLKLKHCHLIKVLPRNSLTTASFNAFLSDIDTTLVIKNGSDHTALLASFLRLRTFFFMLDIPEIYTETEFAHLKKLNSKDEWKLVQFCWHLRKINWCHQTLNKDPDRLTYLKMNRSISTSWKQILKENIPLNRESYFLHDFHFLEKIISSQKETPNNCYCSIYTETLVKPKVVIELSPLQHQYFNSLMPGECIDPLIKDKVTPLYIKSKLSLLFHELYLTNSALKTSHSRGKSTSELQNWCEQIKINISETKVLLLNTLN